MPFRKDRLALVAHVVGWAHLVYQTPDPVAEVMADGYFPSEETGSMVRAGDRLTIVCRPARGLPSQTDCTVVTAGAGGVRLVPLLAAAPPSAVGSPRRHAARDAEIVQLRAAGEKVAAIAARFRVTDAVVRSVLHRARRAADARRAA
jgi:hypothetical protein